MHACQCWSVLGVVFLFCVVCVVVVSFVRVGVCANNWFYVLVFFRVALLCVVWQFGYCVGWLT